MKAFWQWVNDLFSSTGIASTIRVISVTVCVAIIAVWVTANIVYWFRGNNGIVDFAPQCVWIIGTVLAGKVGQAIIEKQPDNSDKPTNAQESNT